LLIGKVDEWPEKTSYGKKLNVLLHLQTMMRRFTGNVVRGESIIYDHSMVVWFIQPNEDMSRFRAGPSAEMSWRALCAYLRGILEAAQLEGKDQLGLSMSYYFMGDASEWHHVHQDFEKLQVIASKVYAGGPGMTILDMGQADGYLSAGHPLED